MPILRPMLRQMLQLLLAVWLSFWAALAGAEELQPIPALKARVTDLTATLSADQRNQLESRLAAFEKEKGAQIAVLIVPTVKPEAIEQYSIRVAEQWKLGRKGVDDGVLLLIAKQDKKLRIEVGYGLEGALNDATARRIIAESITPRFKEGRFHEGIDAGIGRIAAVIGGEPLPPVKAAGGARPADSGNDAGFDFQALLVIGLVLVTVVAGILRAIFGRFFGSAMVGGIAGFIAMLVASSLFIAAIVGVIVFVLALLSGGRGGGWGGWGGGYSGGSWGGSSSGSDSFSGGGGDFGGGGASGDW